MGIISTALAPYRLYAYAAGAVLIIGLSWYALHTHDTNIRLDERTKVLAEDAKALQVAKDIADKQTKVLQAKADQAEHAHDKELALLDQYRNSKPVHGGLCINQNNRQPSMPNHGPSNPVNAGPGPSTADVQPVPAPDSGSSGQQEFDARGMLDLLAARADEVSAQLREWQSR